MDPRTEVLSRLDIWESMASSVKRPTDDNIPLSHFKLTDLAVSLSGPSGTTTLPHLTIHFKLTDLAVSLSGPSDHLIQLVK